MIDLNEWVMRVFGVLSLGSVLLLVVAALANGLLRRWPSSAPFTCRLLRSVSVILVLGCVTLLNTSGTGPTNGPVPWLLAFLVGLWLLAVGWRARAASETYTAEADALKSLERLDDHEPNALFGAVCEELSVSHRPELLTARVDLPAALVGVPPRAIVLPAWLLEWATRADLRLVMAHELVHWKRRDAQWKVLACFVQLLYPLFWIAPLRRYLFNTWEAAQEIACDWEVIRATQVSVRSYGSLLERLAEGHRTYVVQKLAVGAHTLLHRRIAALGNRREAPWSVCLAVGSGSLIAVLCFFAFVTPSQPHETLLSAGTPAAHRPNGLAYFPQRNGNFGRVSRLPSLWERNPSQDFPGPVFRMSIDSVFVTGAIHAAPRKNAESMTVPLCGMELGAWAYLDSNGETKLAESRNGWVLIEWSENKSEDSLKVAGWVWGGYILEPTHHAYQVEEKIKANGTTVRAGEIVVAERNQQGDDRNVLLADGRSVRLPMRLLFPTSMPLSEAP